MSPASMEFLLVLIVMAMNLISFFLGYLCGRSGK